MTSCLEWLFGRGSKNAPRIEGDTVVRIKPFDDTLMNKASVMGWTLRFNDVLDAQKLNDALTRLVSMPSWRRLGGRIRLGVSNYSTPHRMYQISSHAFSRQDEGKLEIHIPSKFTADRPAVRFTHVVHADMSINEHPVAKKLPKPTSDGEPLLIQSGCADFRSLAAPEGAPESLKAYYLTDDPQLGLHVVSFADATLVSFNWSHVTSDAMGMQAVVRAMSLVLAGREAEVPPLVDVDILEELGLDAPTKQGASATSKAGKVDDVVEPYVLADQRMGKWSYARALMRVLYSALFAAPGESHMVVLPPRSMAALRKAAEAGLTDGGAFISDGDILAAWCTQAIVEAEALPGHPCTSVGSSFDIRGRLAILDAARGFYVHNLVLPAFGLLTDWDAQQASLGDVALKLRQGLMQQVTDPQIRAYFREWRGANLPLTGPLYGDPTANFVGLHNWTRAKFFDAVDFSPAVIPAAKGHEKDRWSSHVVGKPVYHHSLVLKKSRGAGVIHIYGKDHGGNYWIHGVFQPKVWPKVREYLDRLEGLSTTDDTKHSV